MKKYLPRFTLFLLILALPCRLAAVPLLPLAFNPTALVFPTTVLGDKASALVVSVRLRDSSTSFGPLSLQLSDPIHFEIVSDACSGTTLENAETCEIGVVFHPSLFGHYSSFIVLLDESQTLGNFVPLEGTGAESGFLPTPPPTSPPSTSVTLIPDHLDFSGLALGDISDSQTATLTNDGTADLFVKAVTFGGDSPFSFARIETCSLRPLNPGGSCDLIVYYTPSQEGLQKAAIAVSDNSDDGPQILSLNGGSGGGTATGGTCALSPRQASPFHAWPVILAISLLVFARRRRLQ